MFTKTNWQVEGEQFHYLENTGHQQQCKGSTTCVHDPINTKKHSNKVLGAPTASSPTLAIPICNHTPTHSQGKVVASYPGFPHRTKNYAYFLRKHGYEARNFECLMYRPVGCMQLYFYVHSTIRIILVVKPRDCLTLYTLQETSLVPRPSWGNWRWRDITWIGSIEVECFGLAIIRLLWLRVHQQRQPNSHMYSRTERKYTHSAFTPTQLGCFSLINTHGEIPAS